VKFEKFHLSKSLETAFFKDKLVPSQIESLKRHCQTYQDGDLPKWKSKNYHPYSSYLGFVTALKAKACLAELNAWGYLKAFESEPVAIIDIGAGTLGATLGAADFLKESGMKLQQILAVDQDINALKWALEHFDSEISAKISLRRTFPEALKPKNAIVLFANVLTELGLKEESFKIEKPGKALKLFEQWMEAADDKSIFVFIEPGTKQTNLNFLKLRDHLSQKYNVLLPCTHRQACPALRLKEWCHEERSYKAPNAYWDLVKALNFRKKTLSFSMLCVGKQESKMKPHLGRVVSRSLPSKGRSTKWICSEGERWKESKLLRNQDEQNSEFFEAVRGSIIDCKKAECSKNRP